MARPPFFGRTAELKRLKGWWQGGVRWVRVVGPPGAGKARLVAEAAQRAEFAVVEVVPCAGQSVLAAAADALEVPRATEDMPAAIANAMEARGELVVVLDGEADVDEARLLIDRIRRGTAETRLVAVGGFPTGDEEALLELGPLPLDEATALLCDRAERWARRTVVPGPEVTALIEALDRLPRALETAARWLDTLSPAELRREVDDLVVPPIRHLTRTAIASLDDVTARLLGLAARCPAGVGRDLLDALLPTEGATERLTAFRRLRDTGLAFEAEARPLRLRVYRHVRRELDHDPQLDAAARHAVHQWLRDADLPTLLQERATVDALMTNLGLEGADETTVSLLESVAPLYLEAGPASTLHDVLRRIAPSRAVAARFALLRGQVQQRLGDPEAAVESLEEARRGAQPPEARARAAASLASAFMSLGREPEAMAAASEVNASAPARARAEALLVEALAHQYQGRRADAERAYVDGQVLLAGAPRTLLTRFFYNHATLRLGEGDGEGATRLLARAEVVARHGRLLPALAWIRSLGALVRLDDADLAGAHDRLTDALDLAERFGDERALAFAERLDALRLAEKGDADAALATIARAFERARQGNPRMLARTSLDACTVALALGEADLALGYLVEGRAEHDRDLLCRGLRRALAVAVGLEAPEVLDVATHELHRAAPGYAPVVTAVRAAYLGEASAPSKPALARLLAPGAQEPSQPHLEVEARGRWFAWESGERVECRRRAPARRILAHLAARHRTHPGEPASAEALIEVGWPGEQMLESAAKNRLYVTLSTLRRLGLRDALLTDGGYLLDPRLSVRIAG